MTSTPTPNQIRWMAGRAAFLALIAGGGVALVFGGSSTGGSITFEVAIGAIAVAISFAVSMALFVVAMPRMGDPRRAVFLSLASGGIAAFVVAALLQPRLAAL